MKRKISQQDLLAKIAKKDEGAFKLLYEQMHKRLYMYLFRLSGDPSLAEDIVVDTFTEVWKSAHKFRGKSSVSTWVIGIARNKLFKELSKCKDKDHLSIEDCPNLTCDKQEIYFRKVLDRDLIEKAMGLLSRNHREILDLVFIHELDYREISEILNIPVNTVKTRVFYAKKRLKEIILNMVGVHK